MNDEWDQFPLATVADARNAYSGTGGRGRAPKLSAQEQNYLNSLREQSRSAGNTLAQYHKAAGAIERSDLDPYRAKQVQSAIPGEDDGGLALGARMNRFLYGVDDQEIADFQYLQALQSGQVLDRQLEQKGVQVEGDAIRLKLTELSPFKTQEANADVIGDGVLRSRLLQARAPFYIEWANRYGGINAVDERGRSADGVWKSIEEEGQSNLATQRQLREREGIGLSPDDLRAYRALAERPGTTAAQLRAFVAERIPGGELVNADEIDAAHDRGAAVRTDFQIRRVQ